jgi:hypothetical protein
VYPLSLSPKILQAGKILQAALLWPAAMVRVSSCSVIAAIDEVL